MTKLIEAENKLNRPVAAMHNLVKLDAISHQKANWHWEETQTPSRIWNDFDFESYEFRISPTAATPDSLLFLYQKTGLRLSTN